MYVLLYINSEGQPSYIQGRVEEINARLRTLWMNGEIDREDWDYRQPWQLLGIEDGGLTPMANVECSSTPYFEVH
jgi:hypothetical protein